MGGALERHPGLRLIIDHMGLSSALKGEPLGPAVANVIKFAHLPNLAVKVSALPCYVAEQYPFPTLHPLVRELESERDDLAFAVVLDHRGTIQGHADARRLGSRFDLPPELEPRPAPARLQARERLLANPDLLVVESPVTSVAGQHLGTALLGMRRAVVERAITDARRAQTVFLATLMALGVGGALILISGLLRPIAALRAGLERIGRGDLDTPLAVRDRTELGLLAEAVNDMAAALKSAQREALEKERLAREVEIAREIQRRLLPAGAHESGGAVLAGWHRAAAEVGGDYYDILPLVDGRVAPYNLFTSGQALREGAYDYLPKPYAFSELLARVEVLARRNSPQEAETAYQVGDLELDRLARTQDVLFDTASQPGHRRVLDHLGYGANGLEIVRRGDRSVTVTLVEPRTELAGLDAYWRAANYLSVGQIYLLENPLLRRPLQHEHIKPRLLGHWGTTPGLNFVYAHMSRAIKQRDLNAIYVFGPGHGGPAAVANAWLEGTYSELYPEIGMDEEGLRQLFRQFSFPGGIGSHVTAEIPGSIHEGGELGYALAHAYGAAFDNPGLVVCCVVGDGEAETGPLAASWHSNRFLNPERDGVVLPILHLNGYKIANPTVLARIPHNELQKLFEGYGHEVHFVEGEDPHHMHQAMARAMDRSLEAISRIQTGAPTGQPRESIRWPMIVLRTPKGWTGPKEVDGQPVEGTHRSHQVPLGKVKDDRSQLAILEEWMRSYRPEELFDQEGRPAEVVRRWPPEGERRMSASPHANGGVKRDLILPDFRVHGVDVTKPGTTFSEPTRVFGDYLRDAMRLNEPHQDLRVFGPDETASNRLQALFDVTGRTWPGRCRSRRCWRRSRRRTCPGWR